MSKKFVRNALAAVIAAMSFVSAHAEFEAYFDTPPVVDTLSKITIKLDAANKQKVQDFVERVTRGDEIAECAAGVSTRCMQSADFSRLWFRGHLIRERPFGLQKFVLLIAKDKDGSVTVSNAAIYPAYTVKGFGTLSKADSNMYFQQDFKSGCWLNSAGHCPGSITFSGAVK